MSAAFKVGDRVKVTFTATVDYISDGEGYAELGHEDGGIATLDPRQAVVEVLRPEVKPGQVWQDGRGRRWFVHALEDSLAGLSCRFVCAGKASARSLPARSRPSGPTPALCSTSGVRTRPRRG